MRAVDVRLTADRGWFGPFHRGVVEADDVTLRAIHAIRLLNDGTSVMLYEYAGEESAARRVAAETFEPDVHDWETATLDDARVMYANVPPSPLVAGILAVLDERRIVVDYPITFHGDDEPVVTVVGASEEIRAALDAVPDAVRVHVDRTGEYRSERDGLLAALTTREREVLEAAVDAGYYRNPRGANYADLADQLDRSTGTVGEHLRNAEAKLMQRLVETEPDGTASPVTLPQ